MVRFGLSLDFVGFACGFDFGFDLDAGLAFVFCFVFDPDAKRRPIPSNGLCIALK